jgi:hypothetical protein
MPLLSTRIVPSELDAVFTVVGEELVVLATGCEAEDVVVPVVLLELLPQAARSTVAASDGTPTFARNRISSLPF